MWWNFTAGVDYTLAEGCATCWVEGNDKVTLLGKDLIESRVSERLHILDR